MRARTVRVGMVITIPFLKIIVWDCFFCQWVSLSVNETKNTFFRTIIDLGRSICGFLP